MLVETKVIVRKRLCKYCNNQFNAKTDHHFFCCTKCKKLYWKKDRTMPTTPPLFHCEHCDKRIQLDFDPKKEITKWALFECPLCGKKRMS
jgi:transcription initiation factor IIE alpha subunit